jgi:hypothetical protein
MIAAACSRRITDALPKGQSARLTYINEFIEKAQRSQFGFASFELSTGGARILSTREASAWQTADALNFCTEHWT